MEGSHVEGTARYEFNTKKDYQGHDLKTLIDPFKEP